MIISNDSGILAERAEELAELERLANVPKHAASMRRRSYLYTIASGVARHQEYTEQGLRTGKPYDGALSVLVALEDAGFTIVRKRS